MIHENVLCGNARLQRIGLHRGNLVVDLLPVVAAHQQLGCCRIKIERDTALKTVAEHIAGRAVRLHLTAEHHNAVHIRQRRSLLTQLPGAEGEGGLAADDPLLCPEAQTGNGFPGGDGAAVGEGQLHRAGLLPVCKHLGSGLQTGEDQLAFVVLHPEDAVGSRPLIGHIHTAHIVIAGGGAPDGIQAAPMGGDVRGGGEDLLPDGLCGKFRAQGIGADLRIGVQTAHRPHALGEISQTVDRAAAQHIHHPQLHDIVRLMEAAPVEVAAVEMEALEIGIVHTLPHGAHQTRFGAVEGGEAAHYEVTEGWVAGLEPKVVLEGEDLVIGWYEPNPTTAEGVKDQVVEVQGEVEKAKEDINSLDEILNGTEENPGGLVGEVEDIADVLYGTEGENPVPGLIDQVEAIEKDLEDNYYTKSETYSKTEVDGLVSGVFHFEGTAESYEALPAEGNTKGDVYQVADQEYAWDGNDWVELGYVVDLSGYYTKEETNAEIKKVQDALDLAEEKIEALEPEVLPPLGKEGEDSQEACRCRRLDDGQSHDFARWKFCGLQHDQFLDDGLEVLYTGIVREFEAD